MILVFKIRENAKVRSENIYNYLTKIEQNANIKFVEIAQKPLTNRAGRAIIEPSEGRRSRARAREKFVNIDLRLSNI